MYIITHKTYKNMAAEETLLWLVLSYSIGILSKAPFSGHHISRIFNPYLGFLLQEAKKLTSAFKHKNI